METKFLLTDKINNLQKEATAVVKFNFENKDYLIYSIKENEENCQIFASRLILNSEGIYFLDNITPEEKNKLNTIIYNLVILTPTESKKGIDPVSLLNDVSNKYQVKISKDIPEFREQEYFSNCSFAITNKALVLEAINFYNSNLHEEEKKEIQPEMPTWNIPSADTSVTPVETVTAPSLEVPAENVISNGIPEISNIDNNPLPSEVTVPEPVLETNIPNNGMPNITFDIPAPTEHFTNLESVVKPVQEDVHTAETPMPTDVAQTSNVGVNNVVSNVAIVSDPTLLNSANITEPVVPNPNAVNNEKAGFAVNKFVIIGTVCLVLAIVVVVVAVILIKKQTTGV